MTTTSRPTAERIVPFPSDPPFLGGKPPASSSSSSSGGVSSRIPSQLFYATLPRSASLPVRQKEAAKNAATANAAEGRFCKAVYEGEFAVKWFEDPRLGLHLFICDCEDVDDSDGAVEPMLINRFTINALSFPPSAMWKVENSKRLTDSCSQPQINAINLRALHRFYRSHAVELSDHWRQQVYQQLQTHMEKEKSWTEKVELTLAYVDAQFNTGHDNMRLALSKVGEALEEKGRYLEAAKVYEDGLHPDVSYTDPPRDSGEFHMRYFAALAYKRSGDFESAEKAYVEALWVDCNVRCCATGPGGRAGKKWDPTESNSQHLLGNILQMYCDYNIEKLNGVTPGTMPFGGSEDVRMSSLCPFLIGLLHCVGYQPGPDKALMFRQVPSIMKAFRPELKSSKKNARDKLLAAVQTRSVEGFRATLASCQQPGKDLEFSLSFVPGLSQREKNKITKGQIRKETTSKIDKDAKTFRKCCNRACANTAEDKALLRCPCHDAYYCRKECQFAHWKEHKKQCSYQQAKQSQKKK